MLFLYYEKPAQGVGVGRAYVASAKENSFCDNGIMVMRSDNCIAKRKRSTSAMLNDNKILIHSKLIRKHQMRSGQASTSFQ